ncbi:MAG: hypothetical protein ACRYFS_06120 [Janthinobacterium lividum]
MIRRFFTRILMVILIAACGYNWLQMQRLEGQVTALQSQQFILKPGTSSKSHSAKPLSLSELQTQWKHLWNQADAFRSISKKAFSHEPSI